MSTNIVSPRDPSYVSYAFAIEFSAGQVFFTGGKVEGQLLPAACYASGSKDVMDS
jgi:hypothetical protein